MKKIIVISGVLLIFSNYLTADNTISSAVGMGVGVGMKNQNVKIPIDGIDRECMKNIVNIIPKMRDNIPQLKVAIESCKKEYLKKEKK